MILNEEQKYLVFGSQSRIIFTKLFPLLKKYVMEKEKVIFLSLLFKCLTPTRSCINHRFIINKSHKPIQLSLAHVTVVRTGDWIEPCHDSLLSILLNLYETPSDIILIKCILVLIPPFLCNITVNYNAIQTMLYKCIVSI